MDPITAAILAAAAAGAIAGLTDTAKQAIADAYAGFKSLLKKKYGETSEVVKAAESVETKPDSDARKGVLKEEVTSTKADKDAELLAAAQALLEKVKAQPGGAQIVSTIIGSGNVSIIGDSNTVTVTQTASDPGSFGKKK